MKNLMTIIALAIAVITFTRCTKDNTKIKKSNVTVINPPGTTTVTPTPTNTFTPTNPTDSFLHLTATINGATWFDANSRDVGNTTTIYLQWVKMNNPYDSVQLEIAVYKDEFNQELLIKPKFSVITTASNHTVTLNTSCITSTQSGWIVASVVPKKGSGKVSSHLTQWLY